MKEVYLLLLLTELEFFSPADSVNIKSNLPTKYDSRQKRREVTMARRTGGLTDGHTTVTTPK